MRDLSDISRHCKSESPFSALEVQGCTLLNYTLHVFVELIKVHKAVLIFVHLVDEVIEQVAATFITLSQLRITDQHSNLLLRNLAIAIIINLIEDAFEVIL